MGCQSSKSAQSPTAIATPLALPSTLPPPSYVTSAPSSTSPVSPATRTTTPLPSHSNHSSPTHKSFSQASASRLRSESVNGIPIRLVGNQFNPVLLQILQVVCSEKSYHESIHRIQIEKVLQRQDYISCEIVGKKIDQTVFLSYLCLLSKAVPTDELTTLPVSASHSLPPVIPLDDSAMISSLIDEKTIFCEFVVNFFFTDLENIGCSSLSQLLKDYIFTLLQWIPGRSPERSAAIEHLLSLLSISVELYANPTHADHTHLLLSFSLTSSDQHQPHLPPLQLKELFHHTIHDLMLKNLLKYCSTSTAPLAPSATATATSPPSAHQIPSPPSPFDRIVSQYSVTTSHCYPYSLLVLYAKRFVLSNWKQVSLPISSNSSLHSIAEISFHCQYPTHHPPPSSSAWNRNGEEQRESDNSCGVEILNDYSIAFQRFLNGFRFHHLSNQIKEGTAAAPFPFFQIEDEPQKEEEKEQGQELQEEEKVKDVVSEDSTASLPGSGPCPLISSQTLIEYIHRFGASFQEGEVMAAAGVGAGGAFPTPRYTFGYHGTNYLPHLQSILTQGFNPLLRNAQLFGPGEYFTRSGYEECSAIYSGRTNMLILSGLILSDELSPPPIVSLPNGAPSTSVRCPATPPSPSSSPPASPSSSLPYIPSPYFVLPNPNPKAYGVTGRYEFIHDYFSYSMPLLLVNWNTAPTAPVSGSIPPEGTLSTEEGGEEEEDWMFDYNHHRDPKELESLPSLQSPSVRSQGGGGGGGDSESGIWTNKSFLTEEESHQYSAKSSYFLEGGGGDSMPFPSDPSSLPPNGSAALPSAEPQSQRRIITASDSYQFNDSEDEEEEGHRQGQGEEQGDGREEKASYSPPLPPSYPHTQSHAPRLQAHQRYQMESFSTTTTSFVGPRHSRSFAALEEEEEEEKRYALLKLKSLMKKQESFLEEDHLHPQRVERAHSNAWFDSIF